MHGAVIMVMLCTQHVCTDEIISLLLATYWGQWLGHALCEWIINSRPDAACYLHHFHLLHLPFFLYSFKPLIPDTFFAQFRQGFQTNKDFNWIGFKCVQSSGDFIVRHRAMLWCYLHWIVCSNYMSIYKRLAWARSTDKITWTLNVPLAIIIPKCSWTHWSGSSGL